jgi:hypothetical protein
VLKHVLLKQTQMVARRGARIFGRADAGDHIEETVANRCACESSILLDYPR